MRTKFKIIAILAAVLASVNLCGCSYNGLPPKTKDAESSYIKPKGEIPTDAEREEVKAIKAEYEAAVKKAGE
jgi:predicted small lipoprotein YifL